MVFEAEANRAARLSYEQAVGSRGKLCSARSQTTMDADLEAGLS